MYWIPSNLFALLQNVLLRLPSVRRVLKIPQPIAKSSADIMAMRNKDNMMTNIVGKIFPKAVKDMKTDTSGIKLLTQQELSALKKLKKTQV